MGKRLRLWGMPAALGAISTTGLVMALMAGGGVGVAGCAMVAVPLVVILYHLFKTGTG